jgi:hypothetical protein
MYAIEKSIPIPSRKRKYPLREMNVGDSFYVPCENGRRKGQSILGLTYVAFPGKTRKFTTRTDATGVRCWRVA